VPVKGILKIVDTCQRHGQKFIGNFYGSRCSFQVLEYLLFVLFVEIFYDIFKTAVTAR